MSLVTALLCSLAPALVGCRPRLDVAVKDAGRGASSRFGRLRSGLVIAQVALAMVLVTGAGLMVQTMRNLSAVDLGFNPNQVLMFDMVLSGDRFQEDMRFDGELATVISPPRVNGFFARVLQGLETVPGVESAATVQNPPLSHGNSSSQVTIHGAREQPVRPHRVVYRAVRGDYFDVMDIPFLQGRAFSDLDSAQAPGVVVINRAMAETHWPNQNPIGRQLTIPAQVNRPGSTKTVVGVVETVNNWSVQQPIPRPAMYVPAVQEGPIKDPSFQPRLTRFLVRTAADPVSLAPDVRRVVARIDSDQVVARVYPMQQLVDIWTDTPRFYTVLTVVFASVALVLSLIGIYGVMAYAVAQRTHEIGIRMALGAARAHVVRLVAGRGLLLGAGGVAVGMTGAFWLTSVLQTFRGDFGDSELSVLFGVSATDPATFAGVSLLIIGAVLLACYNPTRAATKVDPMVALRHE